MQPSRLLDVCEPPLVPARTRLIAIPGRYIFQGIGLPLDDDLPPLVAGAIVCSMALWSEYVPPTA